MKTMTRCRLTLALAVALGAGPVAAEEPSTWEQVKAFTHEKKSEVVAEGRRMVAATDRKIEALKQEAARSSGEVKQAHEQNMKALRAKREAAQAELDRMENSASHSWDATKQGFHKAYQDLHQAYEKAKAGPDRK